MHGGSALLLFTAGDLHESDNNTYIKNKNVDITKIEVVSGLVLCCSLVMGTSGQFRNSFPKRGHKSKVRLSRNDGQEIFIC